MKWILVSLFFCMSEFTERILCTWVNFPRFTMYLKILFSVFTTVCLSLAFLKWSLIKYDFILFAELLIIMKEITLLCIKLFNHFFAHPNQMKRYRMYCRFNWKCLFIHRMRIKILIFWCVSWFIQESILSCCRSSSSVCSTFLEKIYGF